jgi:hypothetical protein
MKAFLKKNPVLAGQMDSLGAQLEQQLVSLVAVPPRMATSGVVSLTVGAAPLAAVSDPSQVADPNYWRASVAAAGWSNVDAVTAMLGGRPGVMASGSRDIVLPDERQATLRDLEYYIQLGDKVTFLYLRGFGDLSQDGVVTAITNSVTWK